MNAQHFSGQQVRVTVTKHQVEADFVQQLLDEAGIPSLYKRTAGFDVPEMLVTGPRDVFVPKELADEARAVLLKADILQVGQAEGNKANHYRSAVMKKIVVVVLSLWLLSAAVVLIVHLAS